MNSFIGRVEIHAHADVSIGANVCINDGVRLITGSHDVRDPAWSPVTAPIVIGDFAWIATGATILPGVSIGKGAVVGASAVVAKDVPDFAIAIGNPARTTPRPRSQNLAYNPVRFVALHNAWLGSPVAVPEQR